MTTECATCCGTGGSGNTTHPGDPDLSQVNLNAVGQYGRNSLWWNFPGQGSHAISHTIIYRSRSDDPDSRQQIVQWAGTAYFDEFADEGVLYFYWIEVVTVNGTVSDLIGPASAEALPIKEKTLQDIVNEIDEGYLAQSLRQEIGKIDINRLNITEELIAQAAVDDGLAVALNELTAFTEETRATVQEEIIARAEADAAQVAKINTIDATVRSTSATLQEEQQVRASADSSLARRLNTAQSQLNGNIASVQTTMETKIQRVDGKVDEIGALWTARTSVNGLIGGFGIYNNGARVDAGFDVDRFWVGRTNYNKVKPFVIENGRTYLDDARIREASIGTLKIEENAVTVPLSASQGRTLQTLEANSLKYSGLRVGGNFNVTSPILVIINIIASVPGMIDCNANAVVRDKFGRQVFQASASLNKGWTTTLTYSHVSLTHQNPGYNEWKLYLGNDWHKGSWQVWGATLTILGAQR